MKRLIIIVICVCSFFICVPGYSEQQDFEGLGTRSDPYLVNNIEDLLLLSKMVNDDGTDFKNVWFQQTQDIDLAGVEWEPIGLFDSNRYFYGIYDGNGHAIRNLMINRQDNAGFFGVLGGTCMNLSIVGGEIIGACCGTISSHAASSAAAIYNCSSTATVRGIRAGGIADNFIGVIFNCWTDCTLEGTDRIGGIVSYSVRKAANCYSTIHLLPEKQFSLTSSAVVDDVNISDVCNSLNSFESIILSEAFGGDKANRWELVDGRLQMGEKQLLDKEQLIKYNSKKIIDAYENYITSESADVACEHLERLKSLIVARDEDRWGIRMPFDLPDRLKSIVNSVWIPYIIAGIAVLALIANMTVKRHGADCHRNRPTGP